MSPSGISASLSCSTGCLAGRSAGKGGVVLAELLSHRSQVPGADDETPLLAVSRSGTRVSSLTVLGPQELLDAWTSAR